MTRTVRLIIAWLLAVVMPLSAYASVATICLQHGLPVQEHHGQVAHASQHGDAPAGITAPAGHAGEHVSRSDASLTGVLSADVTPEPPGGNLPCAACMAAGCKAASLMPGATPVEPLAANQAPVILPPTLRTDPLANVLERPPSTPASIA
jgi:hypothetical protein